MFTVLSSKSFILSFVADKPDGKKKPRAKRKNNGTKVPVARSKEDLENKGKKRRAVEPRPAKKKVLEDTNNSKLRRLVEVRVEDCLRRVNKDLSVAASAPVAVPSPSPSPSPPQSPSPPSPPVIEEDDAKSVPEPVIAPDPEVPAEPTSQFPPAVDDDGPLPSSSPERMELVGDGSAASALLRFPDDRSDSGVSSLRSGSGDERSGSRSSALSSSDEPQAKSVTPATKSSSPVVWREPGAEVRHVHSVQHQTLLMSHPQGGNPGASHYPPPPPMMGHPLHHLPPPATHLYTQHVADMLWKPRYPPQIPVNTHLHPTPAEELLERERAFAQDRDRQDRLIREATRFSNWCGRSSGEVSANSRSYSRTTVLSELSAARLRLRRWQVYCELARGLFACMCALIILRRRIPAKWPFTKHLGPGIVGKKLVYPTNESDVWDPSGKLMWLTEMERTGAERRGGGVHGAVRVRDARCHDS
ncbi:Lysine-specific demethylase 3B [Homalodisca vitripennis]|nr:Lysine-specific demethylase 3B [Homalodisca vitripennis]